MRVGFLLLAAVACNGSDKDDPTKDDPTTDAPPAHTGHTGATTEWACVLAGGVGCEGPESSADIGCADDFAALASLPLDASIPDARSVKTIFDQHDGTLYFMNSVRYPIHWDFASSHLSTPQGFPPVGDLAAFNQTEYYSPSRRFILGAVVYYEKPDKWTYEIAPYDTASAEMVETAFRAIQEHAYFGKDLLFHPSSVGHDTNIVPNLSTDIPVVSTDALFEGIDYQPYNFGKTTGLLTFKTAAEVDGTYTPYRELVVLDAVPNDISIVAGIITEAFQTPLAHINVLSINRGTPNMGLAGATTNEELRALEGKWVELTVEAFGWSVREITAQEAEDFFEQNLKPPPLTPPALDLSVTDLRHVEDIVIDGNDVAAEISLGLTRFGSKGTNYAGCYDVGGMVPVQEAFVIPFYWYDQHMRSNGLRAELEAMMADPQWVDPVFREIKLEELKAHIVAAPLNPLFLTAIHTKTETMWPGSKTRFRSSTNAEDLGKFTGAGLYNSITGDPEVADPEEDSIEWAIKTAWSNLWNPRAYEEREYYGLPQLGVAMALLTTPNFPNEEANGVAITNNIFDTSGLEPAFFVNVQIDEYEVVQPDPGVLPDSYIHYFYTPGQPVTYLSHSNLIPPGTTVLTNQQIQDLGVALDAIHRYFYPVYGDDGEWYGLEVDFKYDDKNTPGQEQLFIKQARPLPWVPGGSLSSCE